MCYLSNQSFYLENCHGNRTTGAYLCDLNIGPYARCKFCDLESETASHLLWNCNKIKPCWYKLFHNLGLNYPNNDFLSSENWITCNFNSPMNNYLIKALVATTTWIIWKSRCNLIFKNCKPNYQNITDKACLVLLCKLTTSKLIKIL